MVMMIMLSSVFAFGTVWRTSKCMSEESCIMISLIAISLFAIYFNVLDCYLNIKMILCVLNYNHDSRVSEQNENQLSRKKLKWKFSLLFGALLAVEALNVPLIVYGAMISKLVEIGPSIESANALYFLVCFK